MWRPNARAIVLALIVAGCGTGSSATPSATTAAIAKVCAHPAPLTTAQCESGVRALVDHPAAAKKLAKATAAINAGVSEVNRAATALPPTLGRHCPSGAYVSSVTTCAFASSIQAAYVASGEGSAGGNVTATSSATGKSYAMTCSTFEGATVTCRGGIGAIVEFAVPSPGAAPPVRAVDGIPVPDPATCSALYAQWQADGETQDNAIVEYGQIGCGQTPRTDGNTWCKNFTATTSQGDAQQQAICDFPPNTPGAYPPTG